MTAGPAAAAEPPTPALLLPPCGQDASAFSTFIRTLRTKLPGAGWSGQTRGSVAMTGSPGFWSTATTLEQP